MSADDPATKENANDDALVQTQREIEALAAEAIKETELPSAVMPPPSRRRWWRIGGGVSDKHAEDEDLMETGALVRLCNAIVVFMLDKGAETATLRRSDGALHIAFAGRGAGRNLVLPGSLAELMTMRYLTMAIGGRRTDARPFFNRIPFYVRNKNYDVSVSITEDAEGSLVTLRLTEGPRP